MDKPFLTYDTTTSADLISEKICHKFDGISCRRLLSWVSPASRETLGSIHMPLGGSWWNSQCCQLNIHRLIDSGWLCILWLRAYVVLSGIHDLESPLLQGMAWPMSIPTSYQRVPRSPESKRGVSTTYVQHVACGGQGGSEDIHQYQQYKKTHSDHSLDKKS